MKNTSSQPLKKDQFPLIIQSNFKILLETHSPLFKQARDAIGDFLELIKSPKLFYTYQLNQISLWNGFSRGYTDNAIIETLKRFSKFRLPESIVKFIQDNFHYYGMFELIAVDKDYCRLVGKDEKLIQKLAQTLKIAKELTVEKYQNKDSLLVPLTYRGVIKSELVNLGFPVKDLIGYLKGKTITINIRPEKLTFRPYQKEAIESFFSTPLVNQDNKEKSENSKKETEQSGLIICPCGAGKTIVGIGIIEKLKKSTLIIVPNIISLKQWKKELSTKTDILPEEIGEYTGKKKKIEKITIATYQQLTYKKNKNAEYIHLQLFNQHDWGLIIYDEVHMLPAEAFRFITGIQSRRRVGLTATLIREDNKEREVYSLIGPKKFDLPWKILEQQSFLARVHCFEVNISMPEKLEYEYFNVDTERAQFRMVAENPQKIVVLKKLLEIFKNHQVLVIGQYLNQLFEIKRQLQLTLITGKTNQQERQNSYKDFNNGKISVLLVSKIANFAVDLPNAEVAIQLSGTYGSRQEETQRLGRIIRPKKKSLNNNAYFFSLVTTCSREELLAQKRKSFLTAQGYYYHNIDDKEILSKNSTELLQKITEETQHKNFSQCP